MSLKTVGADVPTSVEVNVTLLAIASRSSDTVGLLLEPVSLELLFVFVFVILNALPISVLEPVRLIDVDVAAVLVEVAHALPVAEQPYWHT